jgi:hypothetical protein
MSNTIHSIVLMPHQSGSGRRYYSPSPPPRRASRTDNFLDAVDRGHVRDTIGTFRPKSRDNERHRSHHDTSRHHHRGEEYLPDDDAYYYYEEYDDARPHDKHRNHPREVYYYEEDKPTRHSRRKSVHAYTGTHSSGYHQSRHRARSESGPNWRQATEAAVGAGLIEGWRARNDPERMGRIATAAVGAAGTAMLVGREDDSKNKRHVTESTIGGLVLDRVINGSRRR